MSPMTPRTATSLASEIGMAPRTVKRWCADGKIDTLGKLDGTNGAWLISALGVEQAHRLAAAAKEYAAVHAERGAA